jgi:hypothetical protein
MTNFEYAMRVYASIEADKAEILRIMGELYKLDEGHTKERVLIPMATVKESLTVPEPQINAVMDVSAPTVAAKPKIEIISQEGLECVESDLVPTVPPSVFSGDNQAHKDLLKPIFKKCEMDLRKESDKNLATKMKMALEGCPLAGLEASALALHAQLTGKDVELDPGF